MKPDFEIGIVGAGLAGINAALQLKKAGRESFVIFERASEIGGTWRDNVYPGCACDIAVHLYSFASIPNPGWSQLYAGQQEILNYLKQVTLDAGLDRHIRLQADIIEARFLHETCCWRVTDRSGKKTTVSVLLLGMGPLNRPYLPRFAGLEDFEGKAFHTNQWDRLFVATGKRVAVIGTGASAIQVIPAIAGQVEHLTIMQRTPPWVTDRFDKKISAATRKWHRKLPLLQAGKREMFYWLNEFFGLGFLGNKTVNKILAWTILRKLRKEVKDPALRKKLTPQYTVGCKRILKSDDYYPTFNRDNVALVPEEIEKFTRTGIVTKDGSLHPVDAIIFATGFLAADLDLYIRVIGIDGRNLVEEWKKNGAEAYLGTTVSGYPNLALLLGPNTGLGHNSVLHIIESQVNYVMQYIQYLEGLGGKACLDLKKEIQVAYNERIQSQLKQTVWTSGCKSWYMNAKGKNTTLYPGLTLTYRKETKKFVATVYDLYWAEDGKANSG